MAISKTYHLIAQDDAPITLSLEDLREAGEEGYIHLGVEFTAPVNDDRATMRLTTAEAHELRSVLAVMLDVATQADKAAVGDYS